MLLASLINQLLTDKLTKLTCGQVIFRIMRNTNMEIEKIELCSHVVIFMLFQTCVTFMGRKKEMLETNSFAHHYLVLYGKMIPQK